MQLLKRLLTSLAVGLGVATVVLLLAQLDTQVKTGPDAMNEVWVTSSVVAWLWLTYRAGTRPGPVMKVVIALAVGALAGAIFSFLPLDMSIDAGFAVIAGIFVIAAVVTWWWLTFLKESKQASQ